MNGPARPELFGRTVQRIHCLGVGGMGVAPLASYLAQLGYVVSGEDDALTDEVRALLARAGVALGPLPAACDLVAYSSAIAPTHSAYRAAVARGLPLVRRGELLAEVLKPRRLVAVCGSHGKTTTTAMLATALRRAGFPAGWILGGLFADETPAAEVGAGEWVVAEIDESDGTIEHFHPEITVAVNLDWDHPDHYRQRADLEATFSALFGRTRGLTLVNAACAASVRLAPSATTFGLEDGRVHPAYAARIADEAGGRQTLALSGRFELASAVVAARGTFNAANAAAALAAAAAMGAKLAPDLLADYPGVRRRQSLVPGAGGLTVIEDYAHHPAEISALLASLRARLTGHARLVVVFQPHRHSRTAQFRAEFAAALAAADRVHLLDVYAAGEAPVAGGTTADLRAEFDRLGEPVPVEHHRNDKAPPVTSWELVLP